MERQPNIVFMLADNLGVGDLSCFGGPVPTPGTDQLAAGSNVLMQVGGALSNDCAIG